MSVAVVSRVIALHRPLMPEPNQLIDFLTVHLARRLLYHMVPPVLAVKVNPLLPEEVVKLVFATVQPRQNVLFSGINDHLCAVKRFRWPGGGTLILSLVRKGHNNSLLLCAVKAGEPYAESKCFIESYPSDGALFPRHHSWGNTAPLSAGGLPVAGVENRV